MYFGRTDNPYFQRKWFIFENTLKGLQLTFHNSDQLCMLPQSCQRRRQDDTLCSNIEKDYVKCTDVWMFPQGTVEVAHFISNSISWGQKQWVIVLKTVRTCLFSTWELHGYKLLCCSCYEQILDDSWKESVDSIYSHQSILKLRTVSI